MQQNIVSENVTWCKFVRFIARSRPTLRLFIFSLLSLNNIHKHMLHAHGVCTLLEIQIIALAASMTILDKFLPEGVFKRNFAANLLQFFFSCLHNFYLKLQQIYLHKYFI
jgi:hypothetical protein